MRIWAAVVVVLGACSGDGLPTTSQTGLGEPGLVQKIRLASTTVMVGDSLEIWSVVVNRSFRADTVGVPPGDQLGVRGMEFNSHQHDFLQGYFLTPLQPGDSLTGHIITAPVSSPPGEYTLVVRQFATPITGASIKVRVVARPAPDTAARQAGKTG